MTTGSSLPDTYMAQITTTTTTAHNLTEAVYNFTRADLEELNNSRARTLIPAMVVLALLMLIGIAGNTLVCYIFCCRLRSGTQNFLIVCLAVFDLLSCTIAIPNEIADMRFYYMFESATACKIMRFINTFTAIGSIFTLLVIAIDRYRKICKPFGSQLHMRHVRLSLIPVLGGALFFGWPAFVMYGLRTTETGVPGLIGQDCSTPDDIGKTILPLLYNLVLFVCFIILAITLIILYTFVLRETKRHNRYLKRNSDYGLPSYSHNSEDSRSSIDLSPGPYTLSYSPANPEAVTQTNEAFDFSLADPPASSAPGQPHPPGEASTRPEVADNGIPDASLRKLSIAVSSLSQRTDITEISTNSHRPLTSTQSDVTSLSHTRNAINATKRASVSFSEENHDKKSVSIAILANNDSTKSHTSSVKVRRMRIKSKTTIIAFLVTLVFILSFLPHLSLQVAKLIYKGFDYNLQGAALVLYNIFLRSYFINSVSNPIIYGALNVQFSGEVKGLLKRLCRKA